MKSTNYLQSEVGKFIKEHFEKQTLIFLLAIQIIIYTFVVWIINKKNYDIEKNVHKAHKIRYIK
jgi:hypothetical protein